MKTETLEKTKSNVKSKNISTVYVRRLLIFYLVTLIVGLFSGFILNSFIDLKIGTDLLLIIIPLSCTSILMFFYMLKSPTK